MSSQWYLRRWSFLDISAWSTRHVQNLACVCRLFLSEWLNSDQRKRKSGSQTGKKKLAEGISIVDVIISNSPLKSIRKPAQKVGTRRNTVRQDFRKSRKLYPYKVYVNMRPNEGNTGHRPTFYTPSWKKKCTLIPITWIATSSATRRTST